METVLHSTTDHKNYVQQVVHNYFSNPNQSISINQNETLLFEGEKNTRLFYVTQGLLEGYWLDKEGKKIESFVANKGSFIGIPSYFSDTNISLHTVVATKDSTLNYITRDQTVIPFNDTHSLEEQFMPIVVNELIHRQLHVQKLAFEKAQTQKVLAHHEKMAALGKISAGIAHELNNAITVIQHCSLWLSKMLQSLCSSSPEDETNAFQHGLLHGRKRSSKEVRAAAQELSNMYKIPNEMAAHLAQMQLDEKTEQAIANNMDDLNALFQQWELGATLHDMNTASEHAAHVVCSAKALGSKSSKQTSINVNETIEESITLLSSPLRQVQIEQSLNSVEPITANRGNLVQVWVNLLQNAVDSLGSGSIENPTITIKSLMVDGNIQIKITDNGNGIPSEILHKIFDPQFTTKSGEAEVGLGLGLTFVERIISAHNGIIQVNSKPGETAFKVTFPSGASS